MTFSRTRRLEFWALDLDGASQGLAGHLHEMRFGLDAAEAD